VLKSPEEHTKKGRYRGGMAGSLANIESAAAQAAEATKAKDKKKAARALTETVLREFPQLSYEDKMRFQQIVAGVLADAIARSDLPKLGVVSMVTGDNDRYYYTGEGPVRAVAAGDTDAGLIAVSCACDNHNFIWIKPSGGGDFVQLDAREFKVSIACVTCYNGPF
jgi:hypothetical protein